MSAHVALRPSAAGVEAMVMAVEGMAARAQRCSHRSRNAATDERAPPGKAAAGPAKPASEGDHTAACGCAGAGAAEPKTTPKPEAPAGTSGRASPEEATPPQATTFPEGAVVAAAGGSGAEEACKPRPAMRRSASSAMCSALWPLDKMRRRCGVTVTSRSRLIETSLDSMKSKNNRAQAISDCPWQPGGSIPIGGDS